MFEGGPKMNRDVNESGTQIIPDNNFGKHPHHPDKSSRWFWVFDDLTIFAFVIMFVCFIVLFLSPRIE